MRLFIVCLLIFTGSIVSYSQAVYVHVDNKRIYTLLDELAAKDYIDLNSAVKPYTRKFIANALKEANANDLRKRLKYEVEFYLKDFNKELIKDKKYEGRRTDLLYFRGKDMALTVNPVLGAIGRFYGQDFLYERYGGGEFHGFVKGLAGYASLRDHHESEYLSRESFITKRRGANYKGNTLTGGGDFSEMRGGLTYSWKWGSLGLVKDHFEWGNNNSGANIFSGKSPSFGQIVLNIKPKDWIELNYIHGFLVSDVIDSSASFGHSNGFRAVFYNKYLAANFITVRPVKGLHLSFGNSIVYDSHIRAVYLIPFLFYKSVDHTLNSTAGNNTGQNAQMFLDVSSRNIKNTHLYASLFLDELSTFRMFNPDEHTNFYSLKIGVQYFERYFDNWSFIAEYTRTNPVVYKHFVPTTTFESNMYNLGHYLGDNSQEVMFALRGRPFKNLWLNASFTHATKGINRLYTGGRTFRGLDFIDSVKYEVNTLDLSASYEYLNDLEFFCRVSVEHYFRS